MKLLLPLRDLGGVGRCAGALGCAGLDSGYIRYCYGNVSASGVLVVKGEVSRKRRGDTRQAIGRDDASCKSRDEACRKRRGDAGFVNRSPASRKRRGDVKLAVSRDNITLKRRRDASEKRGERRGQHRSSHTALHLVGAVLSFKTGTGGKDSSRATEARHLPWLSQWQETQGQVKKMDLKFSQLDCMKLTTGESEIEGVNLSGIRLDAIQPRPHKVQPLNGKPRGHSATWEILAY